MRPLPSIETVMNSAEIGELVVPTNLHHFRSAIVSLNVENLLQPMMITDLKEGRTFLVMHLLFDSVLGILDRRLKGDKLVSPAAATFEHNQETPIACQSANAKPNLWKTLLSSSAAEPKTRQPMKLESRKTGLLARKASRSRQSLVAPVIVVSISHVGHVRPTAFSLSPSAAERPLGLPMAVARKTPPNTDTRSRRLQPLPPSHCRYLIFLPTSTLLGLLPCPRSPPKTTEEAARLRT